MREMGRRRGVSDGEAQGRRTVRDLSGSAWTRSEEMDGEAGGGAALASRADRRLVDAALGDREPRRWLLSVDAVLF